mmetsp:Transcript_9281/g.15617  ORF Transcript_9281/g.15617 Transcript_9281/m.15617 type:complete len:210 (-) Transcript_9281:798-1427(-)
MLCCSAWMGWVLWACWWAWCSDLASSLSPRLACSSARCLRSCLRSWRAKNRLSWLLVMVAWDWALDALLPPPNSLLSLLVLSESSDFSPFFRLFLSSFLWREPPEVTLGSRVPPRCDWISSWNSSLNLSRLGKTKVLPPALWLANLRIRCADLMLSTSVRLKTLLAAVLEVSTKKLALVLRLWFWVLRPRWLKIWLDLVEALSRGTWVF